MNKKLKNILIISIFIFVGCFSLYSISSCCVIFTDFNLDINHLLNNVFATRDAENFILFKSNYKGEHFDGEISSEIKYELNENYIYVYDSNNKIKYELYACNEKELYCYSLNKNFYYMEIK